MLQWLKSGDNKTIGRPIKKIEVKISRVKTSFLATLGRKSTFRRTSPLKVVNVNPRYIDLYRSQAAFIILYPVTLVSTDFLISKSVGFSLTVFGGNGTDLLPITSAGAALPRYSCGRRLLYHSVNSRQSVTRCRYPIELKYYFQPDSSKFLSYKV